MQTVIRSGNYQVTLNSLGAELKSFKDGSGKEYIWNSDPKFWMRSSPLLFPIIGNVRGDKTTIKGKTYTIKKHGFCKESEFEVVESSESSVCYCLESNEETLSCYPYHFKLYMCYKLEGKELSIEMKVVNTGEDEMFYHIGGHPGIMLPISDGESISDCALVFEKEEDFVSLQYDLENHCFDEDRKVVQSHDGATLPLSEEMFDNDAVFFENTKSHRVSLINVHSKKGVTFDFPDFRSIAFWTPAGVNAPFLCLEPWNGSAIFKQDSDVLCEKRGIISQEPSTEKNYHLKLSLIE